MAPGGSCGKRQQGTASPFVVNLGDGLDNAGKVKDPETLAV